MIFTFKIGGVDHKVEWRDGELSSTSTEIIDIVNELRATHTYLPMDTVMIRVPTDLSLPEGAYALVTAAIFTIADWRSWRLPFPPYPDFPDDGLFH